jgi:mRNA-degrading endonuclease RelE of RelBE toxin-antitoxin system
MNAFQVILTPEAQADIKRLDPAIQTRILDKLDWVGENAELLHHQALRGSLQGASNIVSVTIGSSIK